MGLIFEKEECRDVVVPVQIHLRTKSDRIDHLDVIGIEGQTVTETAVAENAIVPAVRVEVLGVPVLHPREVHGVPVQVPVHLDPGHVTRRNLTGVEGEVVVAEADQILEGDPAVIVTVIVILKKTRKNHPKAAAPKKVLKDKPKKRTKMRLKRNLLK